MTRPTPAPAPGPTGDEGLVIDQLARLAGTTSRNVRAFQARGLLPPPRLRGRTGRYGPDHLRRLRAVLALQGDGFSLAAITALFGAWEAGSTLEEILGLPPHPAVSHPAAADELERLYPVGDWPARQSGPVLVLLPSAMLAGQAAS